MRVRVLVLAVMLACGAQAQDANANKRAAKVEFERGMALSNGGKYAEALQAFEKSRALYATRTNTQNLALTMERLGRYTDALEMLTTLRREFPDMTPEQVAAIDAKEQELKKSVGTLEIAAREGAELSIDGHVVGVMPLSKPIIYLNPGRHEAVLKKAGSGEVTQSFSIAAQQLLRLELVLRAFEPQPEPRPKSRPSQAPPRDPKSAEWIASPKAPPPTKLHLGILVFANVASGDVEPGVPLSHYQEDPGWGAGLDLAYGANEFFGVSASSSTFPDHCPIPPTGETRECGVVDYRLDVMVGYRWHPSLDWDLSLAGRVGWEVLHVSTDSSFELDTSEYFTGWHIGPSLDLSFAISRQFRLGPTLGYYLGYYPRVDDQFAEAHTFFHAGLRAEVGW